MRSMVEGASHANETMFRFRSEQISIKETP
jgi:hypothetical protein